MINFNSHSDAMAPSLLKESLDLRFYSEEERSVAMILVGLTGAFCEVPLVHKYDKNFRGGQFDELHQQRIKEGLNLFAELFTTLWI